MAHTERFGLNQFGGSEGGDVSDEGYKFSLRDRETIDRVLAAFEGHRHTGGLAGVWAATTAFGAGARILPTVRNGHVYVAIVAGLSASSEPSWPTGAAATVTDNEITWQEGGSEQTTQLPDPAGTPTAEVADDDDADLPAGTDLFYRVGFVDAYGLETAASDEVTVTTPDPLPMPEPPAGTATTGGDLEDGPYYYAVSFWQEAGNLQTELSDTTFVVCEVGNNTVTLELPALPGDADGWRIYRLGPNEADLVLLDTQLTADGTTYVDDGTTSVVEPLQFPPDENTTNSHNKVTITAPDLDGDELPTMVRRWRIYRTEESGDYPDQSLVHEVVETTEIGGTILISAWEDLGEPLLDGIPLDTSTTLSPPGSAAVLLYGGGGVGASALDGLSDVTLTTPGSGQVLKYNGTQWVNATVTVPATLDDLSDATISSPSSGQLLRYNGTAWVNATVAVPSTLDNLTDVSAASPDEDDVLQWNGSAWVPAVVSGGGGGAGDVEDLTNVSLAADDPPSIEWLIWAPDDQWYKQPLDITLFAAPSISFLSDVAPMSPAEDDVLTFDGAEWTSAPPSGGEGGSAIAEVADELPATEAAVAAEIAHSANYNQDRVAWAYPFTPTEDMTIEAIEGRARNIAIDNGTYRLGIATDFNAGVAIADIPWLTTSEAQPAYADLTHPGMVIGPDYNTWTLPGSVDLVDGTPYKLVAVNVGVVAYFPLSIHNSLTVDNLTADSDSLFYVTDSDTEFSSAGSGYFPPVRFLAPAPPIPDEGHLLYTKDDGKLKVYVDGEYVPEAADWIAITGGYQNSWDDVGGTNAVGAYAKVDGFVELQGWIEDGAAETITTLPAGYRPAADIWFAVAVQDNGSDAVGTVRITGAGVVWFQFPVSNLPDVRVSLNGIRFRAEA